MLVAEDSPLRRPSVEFSRRQLLILDGLRYAADMADIAYARLESHLQSLAASNGEPAVRDIAMAMLDAWSIVDSAHRFRDLLDNLPGLKKSDWVRLLRARTEDVASLRNCVQHQLGELDDLALYGRGVWGYLSWAEVRNGVHTGKWLMAAPGVHLPGMSWMWMGPAKLPFSVPSGRIRLWAFGMEVYLGRTVLALAEATDSLETELRSGLIRPMDPPAGEPWNRDMVFEGFILVEYEQLPGSRTG